MTSRYFDTLNTGRVDDKHTATAKLISQDPHSFDRNALKGIQGKTLHIPSRYPDRNLQKLEKIDDHINFRLAKESLIIYDPYTFNLKDLKGKPSAQKTFRIGDVGTKEYTDKTFDEFPKKGALTRKDKPPKDFLRNLHKKMLASTGERKELLNSLLGKLKKGDTDKLFNVERIIYDELIRTYAKNVMDGSPVKKAKDEQKEDELDELIEQMDKKKDELIDDEEELTDTDIDDEEDFAVEEEKAEVSHSDPSSDDARSIYQSEIFNFLEDLDNQSLENINDFNEEIDKLVDENMLTTDDVESIREKLNEHFQYLAASNGNPNLKNYREPENISVENIDHIMGNEQTGEELMAKLSEEADREIEEAVEEESKEEKEEELITLTEKEESTLKPNFDNVSLTFTNQANLFMLANALGVDKDIINAVKNSKTMPQKQKNERLANRIWEQMDKPTQQKYATIINHRRDTRKTKLEKVAKLMNMNITNNKNLLRV